MGPEVSKLFYSCSGQRWTRSVCCQTSTPTTLTFHTIQLKREERRGEGDRENP